MRSTSRSEVASIATPRVLSGFGGAGVLEVVKDFGRGTFRAVYTLRYEGTVYAFAFGVNDTKQNSAPGAECRRFGSRL
jgi:hypothetical protein